MFDLTPNLSSVFAPMLRNLGDHGVDAKLVEVVVEAERQAKATHHFLLSTGNSAINSYSSSYGSPF